MVMRFAKFVSKEFLSRFHRVETEPLFQVLSLVDSGREILNLVKLNENKNLCMQKLVEFST